MLPALKRQRRHAVENGNKFEVVLCGFSMGSGLAVLSALDLEPQFPGQLRLFLLGMPRFVNPTLAAVVDCAFEGKVFRFVNEADFLTTLPFAAWPNLSHLTKTKKIGDGHVLEYCHVGTIALLFDASHGLLRFNHQLHTYMQAIIQVSQDKSNMALKP